MKIEFIHRHYIECCGEDNIATKDDLLEVEARILDAIEAMASEMHRLSAMKDDLAASSAKLAAAVQANQSPVSG